MSMENIGAILTIIIAFIGAFIAAFWVSLVIWTFRDIRSRSRDIFAQLLASLLVLIFGPLGLGLYLILRPRETLAEAYERSLEEEALLQDIEDRQVCPGCKHPTEPDFMLCPYCHTRLRKLCPHCGRLLHLRWNVCPYCGSSVASYASPAPAATEPMAGEWETAEREGAPAEATSTPIRSERKVEKLPDEQVTESVSVRRTLGRLTFGPPSPTASSDEPEDQG
ncbi:MAG: zinc ribbon domain-containing protein [Anaerolineae bacterium]|nr:zinc ribbon domain-containing protein [Anaerolineae bacterium]MDH7474154.1 zinc ribbon domain-containing protein [Anaerolineae bacterium]